VLSGARLRSATKNVLSPSSKFRNLGAATRLSLAEYMGMLKTTEQLRRKSFTFHLVGAWLSLVEHLVRDQGVGGSNPLAPTNNFTAVLQRVSECPLQVKRWLYGHRHTTTVIILANYDSGPGKQTRAL
jgi:hypothetical protein